MELYIIGSSSKGNSYILSNGNEALIIEAGVPFKDIKKALGFDISKVAACVVSHCHLDHSKSINDLMNSGITVMSSRSVFEAHSSLAHHRAKIVEPQRGYKAGNFKIIPFQLNHDVYCLGFHISHPECGNILFITDSFMCEYSFDNINHAIIECNYCDEILTSNIDSGRLPIIMKERLMSTHMELQTCKKYLKTIYNPDLRNIILIHLSDGNSDEQRFVTEISGEFGVNTIAGDKEQTISLDLIPY